MWIRALKQNSIRTEKQEWHYAGIAGSKGKIECLLLESLKDIDDTPQKFISDKYKEYLKIQDFNWNFYAFI